MSVRPTADGLANIHFLKYTVAPNCPFSLWCQIVPFSLWCQIVPFYTAVPNCPLLHCCAELSWCQIVLFYTAVPCSRNFFSDKRTY